MKSPSLTRRDTMKAGLVTAAGAAIASGGLPGMAGPSPAFAQAGVEPLGGQPPKGAKPSIKDFDYQIKYQRGFEAVLWNMPAIAIYSFRRAPGLLLDDRCLNLTVPPRITSPTRSRTRSQPRSLLSIARLNIARSRTRRSCCSRVRVAQICRGFKGGFAPMIRPVFQAGRIDGCRAISMIASSLRDAASGVVTSSACSQMRHFQTLDGGPKADIPSSRQAHVRAIAGMVANGTVAPPGRSPKPDGSQSCQNSSSQPTMAEAQAC